MHIIVTLTSAACGGKVLDLGRGTQDGNSGYATPDTIAAEADAGVGVPTLIAQHQYNARAVSVDDTRIYWLTEETGHGFQGFVRSCAKSDCAGTLITYTNETHLRISNSKTAPNSTHLFWTGSLGNGHTTGPYIVACPIGGCAPLPVEILTTFETLNFVVDDEAFFGLLDNATIIRCPASGCQGNPTVLARLSRVPDAPSTRAFAADAANLYWIEGQGSSRTAGEVMTMPKNAATPPRALAPAGHLVHAITAFGSNLYWAESHVRASVKTCVISNCATSTTTIAAAQPHPHHLGVFGASAAWFVCPDGDIFGPPYGKPVAWPVDGLGRRPTIFPADERAPTSLAIDATHIYWTTLAEPSSLLEPFPHGGGAVKRLRLPH
jgi:hypothetical protein